LGGGRTFGDNGNCKRCQGPGISLVYTTKKRAKKENGGIKKKKEEKKEKEKKRE